jgi:hypothetical protein
MPESIKSDRLAEMKRRCEGKLIRVNPYVIGVCARVQTYGEFKPWGSVYLHRHLVLIMEEGPARWLRDDIEIWGE